MIEIKQILFFRTCVDEGSFSRAAEKLYTTQSNVSKVIRSLEKETGAILLNRHSRGVVPTEAGLKVYHSAKIILSAVTNMESLYETSQEKALRIASTSSNYISHKLAEYYKLNYPDQFEYEYWEGSFRHVIRRVENNTSMIGFLHLAEKNMAAFSDLMEKRHLAFCPLNYGQTGLFVGPDNPLYNEDVVSKDMLSELNLIFRDDYAFKPTASNDWLYSPDTPNHGSSCAFLTNSSSLIAELITSTDMAHPAYNIDNRPLRTERVRFIPIKDGDRVVIGYICKKDYIIPPQLTGFLSWL